MNEIQMAHDHAERPGMAACVGKCIAEVIDLILDLTFGVLALQLPLFLPPCLPDISFILLGYLSKIVAYIQECGCVPSLRYLEENVWDRNITREAFRTLVRHVRQAVERNVDAARHWVDFRIEIDGIVAQRSTE